MKTDTSSIRNSTSTNSTSPVPSISSSVIDPNKCLDNSVQEPVQNERENVASSDDGDDDDDENSTSVVNRSAATAANAKSTDDAGGRSKKPNAQTPKKATNKRNVTNAPKDLPDENENCRVSAFN